MNSAAPHPPVDQKAPLSLSCCCSFSQADMLMVTVSPRCNNITAAVSSQPAILFFLFSPSCSTCCRYVSFSFFHAAIAIPTVGRGIFTTGLAWLGGAFLVTFLLLSFFSGARSVLRAFCLQVTYNACVSFLFLQAFNVHLLCSFFVAPRLQCLHSFFHSLPASFTVSPVCTCLLFSGPCVESPNSRPCR